MFDSDNEIIVVILKMIGCNSIDMSWYLQWFNHPVYDTICLYKPWFTIMGSKIEKRGYGACRSAALSAFLKVDNRHSFFIFMRDAIVQLCCCNWSHRSIGSSQELTLRATIAILGSVSSRQLLFHVHWISWKREYVGCMISYEDVTTYQERFASYLTKMLQRIRNILQVTWGRCYNVAGKRYWQCRPQDAITPPKKMCKSYNSPAPPWAPSPKNVTSPWLLAESFQAGGWKTSKLARSVRSIFSCVYKLYIYICIITHTRTYISVYHIYILYYSSSCAMTLRSSQLIHIQLLQAWGWRTLYNILQHKTATVWDSLTHPFQILGRQSCFFCYV